MPASTSSSVFARELAAANRQPRRPRAWWFVAYDQLTDAAGAWTEHPADTGIILIECPAKAARRPYHQQKLATVLTNLRHFAVEQARRGVAVRHVVAERDYASALTALAQELGPISMWTPAERELRCELAPLVKAGHLRQVPHPGLLTSTADFVAACAEPPYRMDRFYRVVRQRTGLLMNGDKPDGGRYSFDGDNRLPWRGSPAAPTPLRFVPDAITREVGELIARHFAHHPGQLDLAAIPASAADAEAQWQWFLREGLEYFGPYEDAMHSSAPQLFHSNLAALLNLHRLWPARVVREVAASDAPLASREGFVRQVLGWREFVRHVHLATDGFRAWPGHASPSAATDGGYAQWAHAPWPGTIPPGAAPSVLGAATPVPPAYWGAPSGLACLDQVVADVWRTGYSHHITRLMVLSNIAALLDVSPRQLTDWFWVAYVDAFDWVVEPNVLGMGTFATGPLMTTKPYIAGSGYISKMSNYCQGCAFDPGSSCPLTPMYWAYLARHRESLADNPRMLVPLAALKKRPPDKQALDAQVFARISAALARGERLAPVDEEGAGSKAAPKAARPAAASRGARGQRARRRPPE